MLPRSKRVSIHRFLEIIKKGEVIHSSFFIMRFVKTVSKSHFAVSVPKKVAKTAVERNKIRRRVYSVLKNLIPRLKHSNDVVLIMKGGSERLSILDLEKKMYEAFVKSGLLK